MTASTRLILGGVALAALSLASVSLGGVAELPSWLAGLVWALVVAKAWVISEAFMGLRRAPLTWRLPMLVWPLLLAGLAWGAALLG